MSAQALTVGPIVGHTTTTSVRLWGRAFAAADIGIAQLFHQSALVGAKQFGMPATTDFTGVVDFDGLTPGREYECRIGSVPSDGTIIAPHEIDCSAASRALPRTRPLDQQELSFVVGSCRRIEFAKNGAPIDSSAAEVPFGALNAMVDQDGVRPDFLLFIGDQIYSDEGGADFLHGPPQGYREGYRNRYRQAFGAAEFRRAVGRISTYMMLDDHEILNNWREDLLTSPPPGIDTATARREGLAAFESYQRCHGPQGIGPAGSYYYTFDVGPARFFVLDTRTQRSLAEGRIVSESQLEALLSWLRTHNGAPRFVATSVPLFPDVWFDRSLNALELLWARIWGRPAGESARDRWSGFPAQRARLLDVIAALEPPAPVFLGGDVHSSFCAALNLNGRPIAWSVVSSGMLGGRALPGWTLRDRLEGWNRGRSDLVGLQGSGGLCGEANGWCGSNNFVVARLAQRDGVWGLDVEIREQSQVTPDRPIHGRCHLSLG